MKESSTTQYDFALVVSGVTELTDEVANALYDAGCNDATVGMFYGNLYIEFSREADNLLLAISSAIHDVQKAKVGANVVRVDECDLVTMTEIGRRSGRSKQQIYQYIRGDRGPGGFPPPECNLTEGHPLWAWCSVSYWLVMNNLIRPEALIEAQTIMLINNLLENRRQKDHNPQLVESVNRIMG